jgi:predicted lipase
MLIDTAIRCMQACINEYGGEHGTKHDVFDSVERFKGKTEGHFGVHNGCLYIVFRGSDGAGDWRDNFKYWQNMHPGKGGSIFFPIKVHAGFRMQFCEVSNQILRKITRYIYSVPDPVIFVTGHSLGGAIATICHLYVDGIKPGVSRLITFGSPRVGNGPFAKEVNKIESENSYSIRYVNGDDIVCKIPTSVQGLRHVSTKIKIGKSKWYKRLTGSAEDHKPEEYMKNLRRFYER